MSFLMARMLDEQLPDSIKTFVASYFNQQARQLNRIILREV